MNTTNNKANRSGCLLILYQTNKTTVCANATASVFESRSVSRKMTQVVKNATAAPAGINKSDVLNLPPRKNGSVATNSGYSSTVLKTIGASVAVKAPPRTPPNATQ